MPVKLTPHDETVLRFLASAGVPMSLSLIGATCAPSSGGSEEWADARIQRLMHEGLVARVQSNAYKATNEGSARVKAAARPTTGSIR